MHTCHLAHITLASFSWKLFTALTLRIRTSHYFTLLFNTTRRTPKRALSLWTDYIFYIARDVQYASGLALT